MKQIILTLLSLILLSAVGCKKDSTNNSSSTSTAVAPVTTALIAGLWRVTHFISNGTNRTNEYGEYRFTFNSNGLLTGANSILSQNGSWSLVNDSNKTKLIINFTAAPIFTELTGDWEVTSRTATRIVMQDVSGGSGQIDYLTIDKI